MSVISEVRNYSLRLLSPPVRAAQEPTSLLSRFYDRAMNFYMRTILRIVFRSKDSFGYMAKRKRKACYNTKRHPLLRDVHTHKSHVPSFNLDGRSLQFKFIRVVQRCLLNKKNIWIINLMCHFALRKLISDSVEFLDKIGSIVLAYRIRTYTVITIFPSCLNWIIIHHWLYTNYGLKVALQNYPKACEKECEACEETYWDYLTL